MKNLSVVKASHGRAFAVRAGDHIRIATPAGTQVSDTWAFAANDLHEHLSMDHTRSVNSNIFVDLGTRLVSNHRRLMMTVVEDTTPGHHDTLLCPCSSEIYRELGGPADHRSCTGNLHDALDEIGLKVSFTPASLNLFMNVPVASDGSVDRLPPRSVAGDSVVLRAEMDLTLVISACPQDITPINGDARTPTDLHIEIWPGDAS
ncbi:urea carboxylase-associated family protein [Mesorhizobium sp. WSM4887]|uniref:urea carboxylase-associated family protein n=1 Tax=Mesorhizobium sp. WSM4887 TaxID=3038543 RepID=UPI002417503E|nr:urea carboxylase-associated family protein [Mesorhizobium sp. WSM4887]MDG4889801.1 urea carboxylase-associated family protein [Mesorhizobium sp. WSM4887]